jgi:DNA-binding IclR family transcriptional regulator
VDDEELAEGLRCVAAPVFDHAGKARYALSISSPAMRLSMDKVATVQSKIKAACRQLSKRLGYQSTNFTN